MGHATSRRALWLQKIADQVAHTLSDRIARGALKPGDPVGDREALASEFVTSVTVIDRTLDQMTEQGVLEPGDGGIYQVSGAPMRAQGFELPEQDTLVDVVAILELRLGLEAVGAAFAAERHDDAQMAEIRSAAQAHEAAAGAGTGAAQADFRFHRAIAAASGNPYLRDLLDYLGPLLIPRMRVALPQATPDLGRDENLTASLQEHRAIVDAIAARDAELARSAMRQHLLRTIALFETSGKG